MNESHLSNRSLAILKGLIERYIHDGQPVGSKTLAADSTLMLSSATIRNIMADLESQGFLRSPHTSAGRIPTTQGFRLFVDNFITVQPPTWEEVEFLRQKLGHDPNAQLLVNRASKLLASITELAGVVTLPKHEKIILKHLEFLPLSEKRVLVVLVINNEEVQNRVIHTQKKYTRSELEQASNFINEHFAGVELAQVRNELANVIETLQSDLVHMFKTVVTITDELSQNEINSDYVLNGEANLLGFTEGEDVSKLRNLFAAFNEKRDILHLLDQSLAAKDIQIFIGEESGHNILDSYSLITAPYFAHGQVVGVLGVIGPTRMRYHRVISAVDITAKLLSQALELE